MRRAVYGVALAAARLAWIGTAAVLVACDAVASRLEGDVYCAAEGGR